MKYETDYNKKLPKQVIRALEILESKGQACAVVGGAVRDLVRGEVPHDYDICTSALPTEVIYWFKRAHCTAFATDKEVSFGRCTVVVNGMELEITTLRSESGSEDNRHPNNVNFVDSFEEDSNRRDFSMNAMYLCLDGTLYDFHNGKYCAETGTVLFIGNHIRRLEEDALRILRYLRFVLKYGDLNSLSGEVIEYNLFRLEDVSVERIKIELEKIFKDRNPNLMIHLFDLGVMDVIYGKDLCTKIKRCTQEVDFHPEVYLVDHIIKVWKNYLRDEIEDMALVWAIIFHDSGKPAHQGLNIFGNKTFYKHEEGSLEIANEFMDRFKFSNEEREKIIFIIKNHMRVVNSTIMKRHKVKSLLREPYIKDLIKFHNYDDMLNEKADSSIFLEEQLATFKEDLEPLVRGRDLIARGMKPSKDFTGILKGMLRLQDDHNLKTKEEVMNLFFKGELDA